MAEQGMADRISYSVSDLNHAMLPAGRYDAAFGIASIHHVSNLAWFFHQLRQTLRPDGLFFMEEYVGSTQFQSPPHVVDMINRFLQILPVRYRVDGFTDGQSLKKSYSNLTYPLILDYESVNFLLNVRLMTHRNLPACELPDLLGEPCIMATREPGSKIVEHFITH